KSIKGRSIAGILTQYFLKKSTGTVVVIAVERGLRFNQPLANRIQRSHRLRNIGPCRLFVGNCNIMKRGLKSIVFRIKIERLGHACKVSRKRQRVRRKPSQVFVEVRREQKS